MTPVIEKIGDLLRHQIGLDVASIGSVALEHSVRVRMKATDVRNLDEYWFRLSEHEELEELIETIIVPETWFFRQHQVFESLAEYAINEWLPKNIVGNFRVLSVPCATGEEAYSAVMALLDAGFPTNRLTVDALDISKCAIQQAKNGFYRPYSFRSQESSFRDRYFTPEADGFRLKHQVRSHVNFFAGNILHLNTIPLADKYDVIFCRNLLIYLDERSRQTLVSELATRLETSGHLFTGSAETIFFNGKGFVPHGETSSSGFRRDQRITSNQPGHHPLPVTGPSKSKNTKAVLRKTVRPMLPIVSRAKDGIVLQQKSRFAEEVNLNSGNVVEELLREAAILADKGHLEMAEQLCERNRQQFGDTGQTFYLLALIYDARGKQEMAEKFYRNALYLDSEHMEALLHLASLLSLKGDSSQAKQLQQRAQRVAERKNLKSG